MLKSFKFESNASWSLISHSVDYIVFSFSNNAILLVKYNRRFSRAVQTKTRRAPEQLTLAQSTRLAYQELDKFEVNSA